MNIIGTIYLVDEPNIEILKNALSCTPSPEGRLGTGTMICVDMDESDNKIEMWFPSHAQKATLLCPPPLAMYKEIDGDQEGFIEAYNEYLDTDDSVQDFIASMLLFLHVGGNILLYTPSFISDDTLWVNTLMLHFYTRYGITIGTSATNPATYDSRYDNVIADMLYYRGFMDIFDFINSSTNMIPSSIVQQKLFFDLLPYCGNEMNPMEMYTYIKNSILRTNVPIVKPAITFEKY